MSDIIGRREFEITLLTIMQKYHRDIEKCHGAVDSLMEDVLDSLGYNTALIQELKEKYDIDFYYS